MIVNRMAVVDWGLGGLGFWKEWRKIRPNEGMVYFSDSGFDPYGRLSADELKERVGQVINWLKTDLGVTHCVIACNAASTIIDDLEHDEVEVCGIIDATIAEVKRLVPQGPLAVAGGGRTIDSGIYPELLPEYEVTGLIAQPLSAEVEAGNVDTGRVGSLVREVLSPGKGTLLLACTHYAALTEVIRNEFPKLELIDPIPGVSRELASKWPAIDGGDWFFTTGDAEGLQERAGRAFQVEVPEAISITVG